MSPNTRSVLVALGAAMVVAYVIDLASGGRIKAEIREVATDHAPPWMVSQVIEEARGYTRQAASEGGE